MEENTGFIPLSSDLQAAGGKTVRAKYFDGNSVHVNERGVANMLSSDMAHIRQPATKAKDSLPQDKKAHRPAQSQERQSYVRDLVVICSEWRGRRLNRERA